jgi:LmbE family N-acetylglucosaminyl deacetylase
VRILVVAAHPDDEVLGCGGTIARLAAQHEVVIGILGEGMTARFDRRVEADVAALARLHEQAWEVGKLLGARDVRLEGLPDNRFDEVALLDIVKKVERWVSDVQPEAVYTHHRGDLNIDHVLTHRAVLTATRPMAGTPVRAIYAFEIPSATEWAFAGPGEAFRPTVFVGIGDTLERKIQAMAIYETEGRTFPHPRSPEALRAIAHRWGSVVGVPAAEAFELVRAVHE